MQLTAAVAMLCTTQPRCNRHAHSAATCGSRQQRRISSAVPACHLGVRLNTSQSQRASKGPPTTKLPQTAPQPPGPPGFFSFQQLWQRAPQQQECGSHPLPAACTGQLHTRAHACTLYALGQSHQRHICEAQLKCSMQPATHNCSHCTEAGAAPTHTARARCG